MISPTIRYLEKAFEEGGRQGLHRAVLGDLHPELLRPDARAGGHARDVDVHAVGAARVGAGAQPGRARAYADRLVDIHDDFMPGFKDAIVGRQVIGPWQMEHEWGLIGGNIFHGELSTDQLFHMRPAPGYADYRTPIRGLYQASSATHAGGGVTGLPGHHVVREIVKDRKRSRFRGPRSMKDDGLGSLARLGDDRLPRPRAPRGLLGLGVRDHRGVARWRSGAVHRSRRSSDQYPVLQFQRVPEPKTIKDRIRLDLRVDDIEEAGRQVIELGGVRAEQDDVREYDVVFRVMLDPEGNEFCLISEA